MNFKQRMAIMQKNKEYILKHKEVPNTQGIYILTRKEDGFNYCYVGQANHLLERLASHLMGYEQHIDRSLKAHGLYKDNNSWIISSTFETDDLDEAEQKFILQYHKLGYQLLNKTSGSQGKGKQQISEYQPRKGYRDGVAQGYRNAQKDIAHLFELHLVVATKKNPPTKLQEKALSKFNDFVSEKGE